MHVFFSFYLCSKKKAPDNSLRDTRDFRELEDDATKSIYSQKEHPKIRGRSFISNHWNYHEELHL